MSSFNILANALIEQVESRARRDDAAWCSECAHDDAAIMASIYAISSLDLRTELRHDSIAEYQLLHLALVAHGVPVGLICAFLDAQDVALMLLALRDADRIGASREAGMGVLESVADENIIDIELAFSDFALDKIALD